ncbi:hypothetical protein GOV11_00065 [Candidatus Woesearchaeota archaeon]|nr:hypothetical protein [Candidatus Woesearchaeota archaeon]
MQRRGSMQLSIEAIIILVIAMVLLGLAIAFIQNFFKTGTDKLQEPFDALEFGCDPTQGRPITTSPTDIELKSGTQMNLKICVYATAEAPKANVDLAGCRSTNPLYLETEPTLLTTSQYIKRTEIGGFNTVLTAVNSENSNDALGVGTYICTLRSYTGEGTDITNLGTRQITISVI